MNATYTYGESVIEFFPFNQEEVDSILAREEEVYMTNSHDYQNLEWTIAANVRVHGLPLRLALPEILKLYESGCTLRTDRYCGLDQNGYPDVTFQKPSSDIQEDLQCIRISMIQQYEAQRYERNKAETERQIAITLDRIQREEEAKVEAAKVKALEKAKAQALADLREAYAE